MNNLKENLENNSIYYSTEKNKHLGIYLTKKVQDLCTKNYKTMPKKLKQHQ